MKETRITEIKAEKRSAEGDAMILSGLPIVYGQTAEIKDPGGSYFEVIERGALDGADLSDVRLLYNHDLNRIPLARTPKTMKLSSSPAGLEMIATLPNTETGREVHEAVRRGDLSGMSFAFTVPDGGDEYDPRTNTRHIRKIAKVYECSICPFPAYPQTSVEARDAFSASMKRYKEKQSLIAFCNEIINK